MTRKILRNFWSALFAALALTLAAAAGARAQSPPTLPGQVLISEFRLAGPGTGGTGSQRDEFIELYNNTDQPLDLSGLLIFGYDPNFNGPGDGADFVQDVPAGATIPARGHFLVGDNGAYSLASYAALDFDTATIFTGDFFIDNEGLLIANSDATVILDTVGFTGSGGRPGENIQYGEGALLPRRTQTAPTVQYAYVRKLTSGTPQDTDDNASDFALVSVTGETFPLSAGGTTPSTLGAPGPENINSPIQHNATLKASLVEPALSSTLPPNRVRNPAPGSCGGANCAQGTLAIRRKFTNTGTNPVTTLRFRVVDITTLGSAGAGLADLRVIASPVADSPLVTSGGTVTLKGTQVEQPPTQTNGGGLNSSVVTITPATPIAPGGSVDIEFNLGVQTNGSYRFFVNVEALTGTPAFTAGPSKVRTAKGQSLKSSDLTQPARVHLRRQPATLLSPNRR
jgi:hypothetical protein